MWGLFTYEMIRCAVIINFLKFRKTNVLISVRGSKSPGLKVSLCYLQGGSSFRHLGSSDSHLRRQAPGVVQRVHEYLTNLKMIRTEGYPELRRDLPGCNWHC